MHVVTPVEEQAPRPHVVGVPTKSSSTSPLQSSSTPLQLASSPAGVPGVQVSPVWPPMHVVTPVEEHAPIPHVVGVPTKSSSTSPLQSSSTPLQLASSPAGVPVVQVSPVWPPMHVVTPVDEEAPSPHVVGVPTKSSSTSPLQSSSTPLQLASSPAGVPGVQVWCAPPMQ